MSLVATANLETNSRWDGSMTAPSLDRALSVARGHARAVLAGGVTITTARAELLQSLKMWTDGNQGISDQVRRTNIAARRVTLHAFDLILAEAEHPTRDVGKSA